MVLVGPKGNPMGRQKGQKTKISPFKRTIVYAELLSVICGVSKMTIFKYFSDRKLTLSNPRAIRKFLEDRLEKFGSLQGIQKTKPTQYKFKKDELPIQGPTHPTILPKK